MGGRWRDGAARSHPRPSCWRKVDALEPATADPHIDVAFESTESPDFKFLRFLRRYRGWLTVGIVARRARRGLHARRPVARPVRNRQRRREAATTSALWAASFVFLVITLIDWWVMWAEHG